MHLWLFENHTIEETEVNEQDVIILHMAVHAVHTVH